RRARGSFAPGLGRALRARPRRAKAGKGDLAQSLGRLADLQGVLAAGPRPQPGRLPGDTSPGFSRGPAPAAPPPAHPVLVGLSEPPVEPGAGTVAAPKLPAGAACAGPLAPRRGPDASAPG